MRHNDHIEPPEGLYERIILRIRHERVRIARIRLAFLGSGLLASAAGTAVAFQYAVAEISRSGFYQYLSLLFSDGIALSYWKEFALSLAESLPVFEITLAFSAVFALLGFLKFAVKNLHPALLPIQSTS